MTAPTTPRPSMFTRAFALDMLERSVAAGAAALLSSWAVLDGALDLFTLNPQDAAGVFLGGMVVSALKSVALGAIDPATGASAGTTTPRGDVAAIDGPAGTVAGPADQDGAAT